jgi:hypothetical protein
MPDKSFDVVINVNSTSGGSALVDANAQIQALNGEAEKLNVNTQGYIDLVAASTREEAAHTAELAQQAAIESQLQVIATTRLELVAAATTGTEAQVKLLQSDLGIRSATLGVMRAQTLSATELNALTEQEAGLLAAAAVETAGVAEGSLLAGVNLSKARQEATVLVRELAVGNVRASTLGSLMGSLGTAVTIGAIAGYELYQVITKASEEALKLTQEQEKQTVEVGHQVDKWIELSKAAGNSGDVLKLSEQMSAELDKTSEKLAEFRAKQLSFFQKWGDDLVTALNPIKAFGMIFGSGVTGDAQKTAADAIARQKSLVQDQVNAFIALNLNAKEYAAEWERIQALPPGEGMDIYARKIDEVKAKLAAIDLSKLSGMDPEKAAAIIKIFTTLGEELELDTKRYNQLGDELDKVNNKHREGATLLREDSLLLQDIRRNQELISQNPFLGADDKQAQLHNLYLREQLSIEQQIAKTTDDISHLQQLGDPKNQAQIDQLIAKLHQLGFTLDELKLKEQQTTFGGEIQADLAKWVNSFGTAAHQIAATIQGTINAALQGTNQLLLDSIFKTGDWRQTLQGVERQVLNLFLTMLEQMALQRIASALGITTTAGVNLVAGPATAAAWAPAAAAVSIATEGEADIIGQAGALQAIATIEGALVAHEGAIIGQDRGGQASGPLNNNERLVRGVVNEGVFTQEQMANMFVDPNATHQFSGQQLQALGRPGDNLGHDALQWTGDKGVQPIGPPPGSIFHTPPGIPGDSPGVTGWTSNDPVNPPGGIWGQRRGRNWRPRKYHLGGAITPEMFAANPGAFGISQAPEGGFRYVSFGPRGSETVYWAAVDYSAESSPGGSDPFGGALDAPPVGGGPVSADPVQLVPMLGGDGTEYSMFINTETGEITGFQFPDGGYASYADVMASGDPTYTSIGDQAAAEVAMFRANADLSGDPNATSATDSMSAAEFEAAIAATYDSRGTDTGSPDSSPDPNDWTVPVTVSRDASVKGAGLGGVYGYGFLSDGSSATSMSGYLATSRMAGRGMVEAMTSTGDLGLTPDSYGGSHALRIRHSGGPLDFGARGSEVDITALIGEGVLNIPAMDHYGGAHFLDALNNMRIPVDRFHYHEGGRIGDDLGHDANPFTGDGTGFIGGGSPVLHQAFFFDKKKAQQFLNDKRGGKKQLIDLLSSMNITGG